jgi:coproporphyrinogen III oxidase
VTGGTFSVGRNRVFGKIDQAWKRYKDGVGERMLQQSSFREVVGVNMGEVVGTNGETWVKIVVGKHRDTVGELFTTFPTTRAQLILDGLTDL